MTAKDKLTETRNEVVLKAFTMLDDQQKAALTKMVQTAAKNRWLENMAKDLGPEGGKSWVLVDYIDHLEVNEKVQCTCGKKGLRYEFIVEYHGETPFVNKAGVRVVPGSRMTLGSSCIHKYSRISKSTVARIVKGIALVSYIRDEVCQQVVKHGGYDGWLRAGGAQAIEMFKVIEGRLNPQTAKQIKWLVAHRLPMTEIQENLVRGVFKEHGTFQQSGQFDEVRNQLDEFLKLRPGHRWGLALLKKMKEGKFTEKDAEYVRGLLAEAKEMTEKVKQEPTQITAQEQAGDKKAELLARIDAVIPHLSGSALELAQSFRKFVEEKGYLTEKPGGRGQLPILVRWEKQFGLAK